MLQLQALNEQFSITDQIQFIQGKGRLPVALAHVIAIDNLVDEQQYSS